jgi:sugar lactone lactonase YvrE
MWFKTNLGVVVLLTFPLLGNTGLFAQDTTRYQAASESFLHCCQKSIVDASHMSDVASTPQFIFSWGVFGAGDGEFDAPHGMAFNSAGEVYVADMGNNRLQKFSADGEFIALWKSASNDSDTFFIPLGVAVDSQDAVYLADSGNNRIIKFTAGGEFVTSWGETGTTEGDFNKPSEIAIDSQDNIYVTDEENHRVQKFTPSGQFVTQWGNFGTGNGEFNLPEGIAIDANDNIYITEFGGNRIQKFTSAGVFITGWGQSGSALGEFLGPNGISIDAAGRVFVVEEGNERGQVFSPDGKFLATWGEPGSGNGEFLGVRRAEINELNQLFVSEIGNQRIQVFDVNPLRPSAVSGLRADVYSSTASEVFWDRADAAYTRYRVYVNGRLKNEIEGTSWFSNSFAGGKNTEVTVTAVGQDGIESEPASISFYNPAIAGSAVTASCLVDNLKVVIYSTTAMEIFWDREPGSPTYAVFLDGDLLVFTTGVSWYIGNFEPGSQHEMRVAPADPGCNANGQIVNFSLRSF